MTVRGAGAESPSTAATVLVADDEELNRDLVSRQLRSEHRVLTAEDGARALEILDREPVDLVLLDVMMPELSGYEVCARIKARQAGFLPVVLLTALNRQQDRRTGFEAGADDFLSKPVNKHELLLRVKALLRVRDQDRTIRAHVAELGRLQSLKDDLVSLIIHDLRNPLTGLHGYLQLLEQEAQTAGCEALLPNVRKAAVSADRLREILEEVLDVRLLEEGELKVQMEEVPLADLAANALAVVEGAGRTAHVRLNLQVEGSPRAKLDPKLVRRATENLISNAIKFAPQDSVVDLIVRQRGEEVEVLVADRGPGVPDAFKKEMFEKFGSLATHAAGERRGFGLGLYLVQLVMRAHGGRAVISDRSGGGTVFRMCFPAAPALYSATVG